MEQANQFTVVLVTAPTLTIARKLANSTLKGRLVACANLIPKIESHYWWEGKLESSSEVLIVFKTTLEQVPELEKCVLQNHPYDTPEIITLPLASGTEKYLAWISNCVATPATE